MVGGYNQTIEIDESMFGNNIQKIVLLRIIWTFTNVYELQEKGNIIRAGFLAGGNVGFLEGW